MDNSIIEKSEVSALVCEIEHKSAEAEHESKADAGTRAEKAMSVQDALRKWPKAILWSFIFGTTIIVEGYDQALLGSFWGYPEFQKQFGRYAEITHGERRGEWEYQVSAKWQSIVSGGICLTAMMGVLIGGYGAQRFGYRPTFIGALSAILICVFGLFFSKNMPTLLAAELCIGIPYGVFSSLGPAYASEIAPLALRGYLATYINACWLMGQLLATGVTRGLLDRTDQWGWRIPFGLQWIWPLPIILAVYIAPESPWHLVRCGKLDAARHALSRCCHEDRGVNLDNHLAMMVQTNELEKACDEGTSYLDCFKGVDLRRTELSCIAWGVQQLCGSPFASQAIYFFTVAGIATKTAYSLGVATFGIGLVGTIISWFLMTWFGRRTIYLYGTSLMTIFMVSIGIAAIFARKSQTALYAQSALMLTFVFTYNMSVGPLGYSLVTEMSATRLRAKTVGLARCFYMFCGLVAMVVQPYLINPTALNLKGRVGFIWAGLGAMCTTWIYFRLPEPRNRTYEEMDIMFIRKVPARKFNGYVAKHLKDSIHGQV